jgi:integrase
MATTSFFLKENNPKQNRPTLIFLSFSYDGKRMRISTQEKIHAKNWNQNDQRARKTETGWQELNDRLNKIEEDYQKAYRILKSINKKITPEALTEKVDEINGVVNKDNKTFMGFIKEYIETAVFKVKQGTIKSYKTTQSVLTKYQMHRNKRIDFDHIDLNFYDDFIRYLSLQLDYSANTIGKHIKNIKVFMTEATNRGLNNNFDYLKKGFKVFKEDIDNIYLTEDEIKILFHLDLNNNEKLSYTRDLFIVGCYTGLRFSDFSQIKKESIRNGMISLRTQKTNELVTIPVHPMVDDIMKKYKGVFSNSLPPAFANQVMNRNLKELGKLAQLNEGVIISKTIGGKKINQTFKKRELITTHTARRSFATNLYLQEFPAISIMKITGHKSEKNFMNYIKMTPHQNAEKLRKHWELIYKKNAA